MAGMSPRRARNPLEGVPALILELRPDLRRRFGFHKPERRGAYLAWLVCNGLNEYAALARDPSFVRMLQYPARDGITVLQGMVLALRPDVRKAFPLPERRRDFRTWFYTHGVEEHGLWPLLTQLERRWLRALGEPWRSRLAPLIAAFQDRYGNGHTAAERAFGVNVIGYAYGQFGIGEDTRMAARALLAAGVPVTMLDFPAGKDVPQNDRSMATHVSDVGPFAINLFCMTALETGRYFAKRGKSQFVGRYNIGYWPWELGKWPRAWRQMVELVDEVWVSSRHTYNAVAPVCAAHHAVAFGATRPHGGRGTIPVRLMPMAVELEALGRRTRARMRSRFDLPAEARLFVFTFDLNSSIHRKNPQAAVDAFVRAFPAKRWGQDEVGLVIKVHPPQRRNRAWDNLKALAARNRRLHIIEETLPRPQLLALYKACDCFVSLHRAEGFGRGIAEALQLGLHVIATGYGGNVDFCADPALADRVDLVRYRMIKLRRGQYPYGEGQVWANPDLRHAAQCMQALVRRFPPGSGRFPLHRPHSDGWPAFSASVVGARYRQRLEEIRAVVIPERTR